MTSEPTRLLIADDHTLLREGLRRSLVGRGYEVVGEAGNGSAALSLYRETSPDLVLMDITMPVLGGLEATRRILSDDPDAKVIMLTMHVDESLTKDAKTAGAYGYLIKDCSTDDIVEAIDKALAGTKTYPQASGGGSDYGLTKREVAILQLLADGLSAGEAAEKLYVSHKTVKNHLGSTYAKLDAHDRTQAVLKAANLGLIRLSRS